jgi:hypothetical protein
MILTSDNTLKGGGMNRIKNILMQRDSNSETEATTRINKAVQELQIEIDTEDFNVFSVERIIQQHFNLTDLLYAEELMNMAV